MAVQLGEASELEDGLNQTEVFELLGNDRRRHALHHLMNLEEGTDIRGLSEQVAAWETGKPVEEVTSDERRRVYVSLHQTHLPRLNDAGVLDYADSGDTIELTEEGENLRVYMEVVTGNDIPWSVFYLGLTVLGGSLVSATVVGAPPFHLIPELGIGVIIVFLFTVASLAHVVVTRRQQLGGGEKPPELG